MMMDHEVYKKWDHEHKKKKRQWIAIYKIKNNKTIVK
jgi:hypothetical protein